MNVLDRMCYLVRIAKKHLSNARRKYKLTFDWSARHIRLFNVNNIIHVTSLPAPKRRQGMTSTVEDTSFRQQPENV